MAIVLASSMEIDVLILLKRYELASPRQSPKNPERERRVRDEREAERERNKEKKLLLEFFFPGRRVGFG